MIVRRIYQNAGINFNTYVTKINAEGVKILEKSKQIKR
jgi:hypothetical protein